MSYVYLKLRIPTVKSNCYNYAVSSMLVGTCRLPYKPAKASGRYAGCRMARDIVATLADAGRATRTLPTCNLTPRLANGRRLASPPWPAVDREWGRELVDTRNVSFVSGPEVHDLFVNRSFMIVLVNPSRVANQIEFVRCESVLV